jgi:hypothetical protein
MLTISIFIPIWLRPDLRHFSPCQAIFFFRWLLWCVVPMSRLQLRRICVYTHSSQSEFMPVWSVVTRTWNDPQRATTTQQRATTSHNDPTTRHNDPQQATRIQQQPTRRHSEATMIPQRSRTRHNDPTTTPKQPITNRWTIYQLLKHGTSHDDPQRSSHNDPTTSHNDPKMTVSCNFAC